MQELRRMFNDFNKQQNQKIETLITSINEIKQQNVEIRESISFLSAKYDDVLKELEHIKEENSLKTCLINSLEQKIELLERNARSTMAEIKNIPRAQYENKNELISLVKNLGEIINMKILDTDIKDVFSAKG
ncbi:unnamed protein product [Parnassius apollo]|uniref:(apollo) hypothetical protein n=1 Tax=Parnassius apollo TaxID=110799 RepID=A0A8S3Y6M5_PARAO|nr:unnamed protein product [Parnassius apollo]